MSTMHSSILLTCAFLLTATISPRIPPTQTSDDLVVTTRTGKVRGVARRSSGAEFLGIPYANAPVGQLRWHEPVPMKPWASVRDATAFGAPCAQAILGDWNRRDSETSQEDCLFLNVITAAWPAKTHLPVMFWIHGGANAGGTAASPLYKDGTLVNHGVILVTVNYRLGIFGFFAHPGLTSESPHKASGNYALMDQIAALRWVHDNIAKFGGDPNNITVFGESAGAQDTSLLMTSPLAHGVFQRAIAQSGSAVNPPAPTLADSEKSGERIASILKAPSGNAAIEYLRGKSTNELLTAIPPQDPTQLPLLGPNVDGWVIPNAPDRVFYEHQQSPVPLIIGTTTREFGFAAPVDAVRKFIQNVTGPLSDRTLAVYGLENNGSGTSDPMYGPVGDQWFADLVFRCPASTQAASQSTLNKSTYQYELEHVLPGRETQGAFHGADLPYVFGYYPQSGNLSGNYNQLDFNLADLIEMYWTNFARTGNPNSGSLPKWPESNDSQTFIRFTQEGDVKVISGGLRPNQCDLFRQVLKQRIEQSR
jgi:para-nitrobenzyl esterase